MKHLPVLGSLAMVVSGLLVTAHPAWAMAGSVNPQETLGSDFLFGSPGFLGVDLQEIEPDKISSLRLKDAHGAEVVLVDHDAPAGKSGLKVHDVILKLDGQPVESADQLRRSLHEMPSGRTINLLVSRDGSPLAISVKLCDKAALQKETWKQHINGAEPPMSESFVAPSGPGGPAFLHKMIPRYMNVGAEVNPVHTQLADYFGVISGTGLLVVNVDYQSPASRAGLKAGDVVTKVDTQAMTSRGDWQKAMRNHRGQPVQVTIMRNKQEMVLTMNTAKAKKLAGN
jgi:serine protease Do